jgi:hypothetical protein
MRTAFILILILFLNSCGQPSIEGVWYIDYKNSLDLKKELIKKKNESNLEDESMAFMAIGIMDAFLGSFIVSDKKFIFGGSVCTINSIGATQGVDCLNNETKKIKKMSIVPENGKLAVYSEDTESSKIVYTREKQDYKIVWADIFKKEIKEPTETSKQSIPPVETITTTTAENNSMKKEEPSAEIKPSFDCSKKSTPSEIAICSDSNLAKLDKENYDAFIRARKVDPESTKITLMNSLEQRKRCGANKSCIADSLSYSEGEYQAIITLSGLKK